MAGEQKAKSATPGPRKPGDRVTAVLVPQGSLAGQPDVPLNRPVTTVGSNDNARLHLVSRTVSKGHAIFVNSGGVTYVADLASRTGVLVNGKLIRDADLKTGDRVQIGKFLFRYRSAPGASPAPANIPPLASVILVGSPARQIGGRVFQIGRRDNSDICIANDSAVSAGHAVIFEMDGQWYIRDLGSRTGTLVNNKAIHQQVLNFGDRITISSATILFQPGVAQSDEPAQDEVAPVQVADLADETLELEEDEAAPQRPAVPAVRAEEAIPLADEKPRVAVDWKSAFPATTSEEEVTNPLEEIAGATAEEPVAADEVDESIELELEPAAEETEPAPVEESIEPIAEEPEEELSLELEPEPVAADEEVAEPVAVDDAIAEPGGFELEPVLTNEVASEPESVVEEVAEPVAVEPEPVLADELSLEPEPVVEEAAEPIAIEPEPVAEETVEPIELEPEPVAEETAEPVAVEPEPVVEETAEPIAVEPEPAVEEIAEPIAIAPEPVAKQIAEPTAVEPEPVLAEEAIAPIAVEPEPQPIAAAPIAPPPVAKITPPKPAAVEPPPKPVVVKPASAISKPPPELEAPVEDFIFVPMDEPVDPGSVPDELFWGDESARPAAPLAEVPRETQPANQDQQTEESQTATEAEIVSAHLPETKSIEPAAEIAAEPIELPTSDQGSQSMADAIAEAQQLLAEANSAIPAEPAELEHTEVHPAEATAPQAVDVEAETAAPIVANVQSAADVHAAVHAVESPAPSTTFSGVVSHQDLPDSPAAPAVHDADVDVQPAINAPLTSATSVNAQAVDVDVPTAAPASNVRAVASRVRTPSAARAIAAEVVIGAAPSIDAPITKLLHAADAVSSEISAHSHSIPTDIAAEESQLELDQSPAVATLEAELPEVEAETEPHLATEISAVAQDEIEVDQPAAELPVEPEQATKEPAFDFAAEEMAAESAANETVEPDLSHDDSADHPLDPLSDSFPLVEPVEDTATPAELAETVEDSNGLTDIEAVEAPAEIAGVSNVTETPTEDHTTTSGHTSAPAPDTNESDLDFLDFGDENPAEPAAPAPAADAPSAPAGSTDPLGPAQGPSIFGFQFEGGSFLGGMPISLAKPAPAAKEPPPQPAAPSPVFDARAKAPAGLGGMVAAAAVAAATPPPPLAPPPPVPPAPVVNEAPKTGRPQTPPRPIIHQPAAPQRPLSSNFAAPGAPPRTADVFSQMSAPIGVEVFGGRPGNPNQFNVPDTRPAQPGDQAPHFTPAEAPAPVLPVAPAKKSSLILPLLILLTAAVPAGLFYGIYTYLPVSTPITGSVSYDGLLTQEANDAHAFRVMQQSWLASDDVRQRAQAILEQKNLPHGFTDDQDTYNSVVNNASVVAETNTVKFTYNTTNQQLGTAQVQAVMDGLAQKDKELDDAKVVKIREARAAKKNVDDLANTISNLDKQRAEEDDKFRRGPDRLQVAAADQEASQLNQAWLDAKKVCENNQLVLAELQKQDPTQPIDVEADQQVIALKNQLQQIEDQITRARGANAVEAGSKTSIGTDVSVGATTQPDANPLLIPLQREVDRLTGDLEARRAELAADAALGPEQRAVNKAKRIENLSVKIHALQSTAADAEIAAHNAANSAKDIHDELTNANLARAKLDDLAVKKQEALDSRKKAVDESAEKEAALSRCVTVDHSSEGATKIILGDKTDMRLKLSSVVSAGALLLLAMLDVMEFKRRPRHTRVLVPAAAPRSVPQARVPWPQPGELEGLEISGEPPVAGEPDQVFGV